MDELAGDKLLPRRIPEAGRIAVAKVRDRLVLLVQDGHHALQVRHEELFLLIEVHVARHSDAFRHEAEMISLKRHHLNSTVAAIRDDQFRIAVTRVNPKTVRTVHLAWIFARSAN